MEQTTKTDKYTILLIDDEQSQIDYLKRYIESSPYLEKWIEIPIKTALANPNAIHIANKIKEEYLEYDVILSDLYMPSPQDGGLKIIETLEECHKKDTDGAPKLIVISNKPDAEETVSDYNAKYSSWFRFYQKPTEPERYGPTYKEGENWAVALSYAILTLNDPCKFSLPVVAENTICFSQKMKDIFETAKKAANSQDTTVLLLGDTGTGKGELAKFIHNNSPRDQRPFIKIDCASIPDNLLESELFGHERYAFTGANTRKEGLFLLAKEGTLFLDEIGDVPLTTQLKLLEFLQDKKFRTVGGVKEISVNARIIAATNIDLKKAVASGQFRNDLYFRLNVLPIILPPLRERKEDILPLANHFLKRFCTKLKKPPLKLTHEAEQILISYNWPGNVRELESTIERSTVLAISNLITFNDLRYLTDDFITKNTKIEEPMVEATQDITDTDIIALAVKHTAGHWDNAAREVGLEYREFTTRLKNAILKILSTVNRSRAIELIGISRAPFYTTWRLKLGLW